MLKLSNNRKSAVKERPTKKGLTYQDGAGIARVVFVSTNSWRKNALNIINAIRITNCFFTYFYCFLSSPIRFIALQDKKRFKKGQYRWQIEREIFFWVIWFNQFMDLTMIKSYQFPFATGCSAEIDLQTHGSQAHYRNNTTICCLSTTTKKKVQKKEKVNKLQLILLSFVLSLLFVSSIWHNFSPFCQVSNCWSKITESILCQHVE